jgi:DNA-binding MarR family transcriptional regulator
MPEPTLQEFAERLSAVLPVMCKSMVRYEQNALTTGELTLPQFWALTWVHERDRAAMHDLAVSLAMNPSTATLLVDRLVGKKLMSRVRDRSDRRRVLVRVTPRGRRMLEEIHTQKRKALLETFRPLTARERSRYLELVETLARRIESTFQQPRG